MAQCIARAPGGPTHVLLDDRIAEHVPGCNMAFRREALLAIGGFNPDLPARRRRCGRVLAAAGARLEDRLRGGGARLASPSRRRSRRTGGSRSATARARRWLMAHHPEKFLDGRMLWRGRIYSPLPFVRSLWGTTHQRRRLGHGGVSVGLPHRRPSVRVPAALDPLAGAVVRADDRRRRSSPRSAATRGRRRCCSAPAWSASPSTIAKNIAYALRSDVDSLPGSRLWYRATVAYLHFIQPFARVRGRIRGMLSPPEVALPHGRAADEPRAAAVARARPGARCCCCPARVTEDRFWSETWTSADRVLPQLTDWLRRSRAVRTIEIDEGWSDDRDVSVLVGRWAWLDVRALVEDHGGGKVAAARQHAPAADDLRRRQRARRSAPALLVAAGAGVALRWPLAGAIAAGADARRSIALSLRGGRRRRPRSCGAASSSVTRRPAA